MEIDIHSFFDGWVENDLELELMSHAETEAVRSKTMKKIQKGQTRRRSISRLLLVAAVITLLGTSIWAAMSNVLIRHVSDTNLAPEELTDLLPRVELSDGSPDENLAIQFSGEPVAEMPKWVGFRCGYVPEAFRAREVFAPAAELDRGQAAKQSQMPREELESIYYAWERSYTPLEDVDADEIAAWFSDLVGGLTENEKEIVKQAVSVWTKDNEAFYRILSALPDPVQEQIDSLAWYLRTNVAPNCHNYFYTIVAYSSDQTLGKEFVAGCPVSDATELEIGGRTAVAFTMDQSEGNSSNILIFDEDLGSVIHVGGFMPMEITRAIAEGIEFVQTDIPINREKWGRQFDWNIIYVARG